MTLPKKCDLPSKTQFVKYNSLEWYSITITVADDKLQFWNDPWNIRPVNFMKFFHKYFEFLGRHAFYEFHLEVSKKSRLHFHGVIRPRNELSFLLTVPHKLEVLGFYEIDTIDDIDIWRKYYTKQSELWKTYLPEFDPVLKFQQPNPIKAIEIPIDTDSDTSISLGRREPPPVRRARRAASTQRSCLAASAPSARSASATRKRSKKLKNSYSIQL